MADLLSNLPDWKAAALAEAKLRGLGSGEVAAMDYRDVAGLSGVTIGKDGRSPKGFWYRAIRNRVTQELAQDARVAEANRLRDTLAAADLTATVTVDTKTLEVIVTNAKTRSVKVALSG